LGKGSTTHRYTDEFKRDAVALFRSSGRPIKEVARELGISDTSLGTWVRQWERTAPAEQVESAGEEARCPWP
jgi:transposase